MNKINFRKDALDGLVGQGKRYTVFDAKTPSLCLIVYPSNAKTFFLYRNVKGRPKRIKIGRYPDLSVENARKEAARLNGLIALGRDPHEERKAERKEMTFYELYETYHNQYLVPFNKKNINQDRKRLEQHFFPFYGNHKASTITPEKIRQRHAEIGLKSKSSANRVIEIISPVFNFGRKIGAYNANNPCSALTKFKKTSRDRFLSTEELTSFFTALQSEEQLYQDYFSLLLFTGVRKSNQLSMRYAAVDFILSRWRLSDAQTKNGEVNIIYLPKPALEILKRRMEENKKSETPSLFVFPGSGKMGHLKDPKKSFQRIRDRMKVQDIRIHDLRRTLGSYMAITGASLPIIGGALNHKSQDSTEIYARLSQTPIDNAVNKAVNVMIGNNIFSRFMENKELLAVALEGNETIRFSDLIAA
ncbi:site-specific integrase [Chitinophaga pendula]|uniref:tyrosine-type recombinase/integrase n=1 Tax=Chitinophaga TaxID=79328 RepID=UPI000BB0610C|nr:MULTISPECIES: site-specific integrase [Chitinophaga]ASZ13269.1 recombinase XerD [Chitinophaga sp. MD30]UCJ09108.1 site-specific integrase [Chitinophaga pendula]